MIEPVGDGRLFVLAQPAQQALAGVQQLAGVGQLPLLAFQVRDFALRQIQRRQFPQVIAQNIEPGVAFGGGLPQVAQLPPQPTPGLILLDQFCDQRLVAGVVVQQLPLGLAPQQGLMLVLAVNIHQPFTQFPQRLGRLGHAVDVAARAASTGDDPPQLAFPVAVQVALGQPGARRRQGIEIEQGAEIGPFRPMADHVAVGAVAQQQTDGVHQDGFAGAGFAGDRGHPGRQFQFQFLDNSEIADAQLGQHGGQKDQVKGVASGLKPQFSLARSSSK